MIRCSSGSINSYATKSKSFIISTLIVFELTIPDTKFLAFAKFFCIFLEMSFFINNSPLIVAYGTDGKFNKEPNE